MRTCPSCGRFITDASASVCPNCGASLAMGDSAPQSPANEPVGAPPYTPYAPPAPDAPTAPQEPPYGPPAGQPPYGPAYGAPAPYSQPYQPAPPTGAYAPPSQPMAPPYGQPPYGAYGAYGPPTGYPSGYPGAVPPGADWKPGQRPNRTPWGRIIGGTVAALVVIAVVAGVIYGISQAATHNSGATASATATATQNSSVTLLSDSMLTEDASWAHDTHCSFESDGYHIHGDYICFAPIGVQTDGTETVTVEAKSGPTTYPYGLALRWVSHANYYFFGVDANSKWVFDLAQNGKVTRLQDFTANAAVHGGLNTRNTLSVTMSGSTFVCSVNGVKVGTIHDSTFTQGKWGLEGNDYDNVVFTNYLAQR